MTPSTAVKAIGKGLSFLMKSRGHGAFPSFLYFDGERFKDPSHFVTGLVTLNLLGIENRVARDLVSTAAEYLKRVRPAGGVWRYWDGPGVPYGQRILRDTDDSAVLSLVLYKTVGEWPECLDVLIRMRDSQGKFGTWITDDPCEAALPINHSCETDAPDLVVNLNVALLLESLGLQQPGVGRWAMESVESCKVAEDTMFYRVSAPYSVYQAVVRNRDAGVVGLDSNDSVITRDLKQRWDSDTAWGSPLATALAVDTLCTLGTEGELVAVGVRSLVAMQQEDGSWPASPMYGSPSRLHDGFGSEALTTSFVVRALSRASL